MPLPDVQFADVSSSRVETAVITGFEAAARAAGQTDFKLYPGDPRRLFLQAVALMIVQQNILIDMTGKSNLLRYAGNATIEDLGWLYGTRGDRLQPTAAMTTVEFTLSEARSSVTTIAQYTRITTGDLTFATVAPLEIEAGELTGRVLAICDEFGAKGNGMVPGQILQVINRPPFVQSATNVTESQGGSDLEGLEAYRERVRAVPESFSTAGPDMAYWFWAKTANPAIVDVDVWMPDLDHELFMLFLEEIKADGLAVIDEAEAVIWYQRFMELCRETGTGPGNVNVVPLLEGGKIPSQDILDAVYAICNDRNRRPLTDFLHVLPPEPVPYEIKMKYWIDVSRATEAVQIQAAVEAAVREYIEWQHGMLARPIIPDKLVQLCIDAGARRTEVESPVYTNLKQGQVPQLVNFDMETNVIYGGLERRL